MFKTNGKMEKLEFTTEFWIFSIFTRSSTFLTACWLSIFMLCQPDPSVLWLDRSEHSHKKRKDSLEGSLDRVLFVAELEFLTILVPRLPQHTSDVNTECAGKSEWSKQLYSLYLTSFLEHLYILILLFWY